MKDKEIISILKEEVVKMTRTNRKKLLNDVDLGKEKPIDAIRIAKVEMLKHKKNVSFCFRRKLKPKCYEGTTIVSPETFNKICNIFIDFEDATRA